MKLTQDELLSIFKSEHFLRVYTLNSKERIKHSIKESNIFDREFILSDSRETQTRTLSENKQVLSVSNA